MINQAVLDALRLRASVDVFDRGPVAGVWRQPMTFAQRLLGWLPRMLAMPAKRPVSLYLALSGGRGQWIDLGYLMFGRLCGARLFVHHHSYAYLNAPSWRSRLFFRAAKQATHIVLSDGMGQRLAAAYPNACARRLVVSNAGFVAPAPAPPTPVAEWVQGDGSGGRQEVTVAYLSAVSEDKGIWVFMTILDRLRSQGLPVTGIVAGPLDARIRDDFLGAVAGRAHLSYAGPVYGVAKERFLASADLLLFPTQYLNEAQPVTLFEALSQGLRCVAADRGAIAEQVPSACGHVAPLDDLLRLMEREVIALTQLDGGARVRGRAAVADEFRRMHEVARSQLSGLVSELTRGE